MPPTTHRIAACVTVLLGVSSATLAGPPDGYYATVDVTYPTTLRATLHAVIDDHARYPYTSPNNTERRVWRRVVGCAVDQLPNGGDQLAAITGHFNVIVRLDRRG